MSDSESNENENDQVVNLTEYMDEIEQADLILKASEGDTCTYSKVCCTTRR